MAHIKWIGIIKSELAEYQKGHSDIKAKKMVLPATTKEMIIKALPYTIIPIIIIFYRCFFP